MSERDRRVYTPEPGDYDILGEEREPQTRRVMLIALMVIALGALGAVAWNVYGGYGDAPPLIEAQAGDIKTIAPQSSPPALDNHELDDAIASAKPADQAASAQPQAQAAAPPPPVLGAPYAPQPQGGYLAQLAALRSEDDARAAWRALTARAPELARGAHSQVQRADLGAQGVYYRLRVGFFDSNARAGAYCAHARAAGQDCMVVSR